MQAMQAPFSSHTAFETCHLRRGAWPSCHITVTMDLIDPISWRPRPRLDRIMALQYCLGRNDCRGDPDDVKMKDLGDLTSWR